MSIAPHSIFYTLCRSLSQENTMACYDQRGIETRGLAAPEGNSSAIVVRMLSSRVVSFPTSFLRAEQRTTCVAISTCGEQYRAASDTALAMDQDSRESSAFCTLRCIFTEDVTRDQR